MAGAAEMGRVTVAEIGRYQRHACRRRRRSVCTPAEATVEGDITVADLAGSLTDLGDVLKLTKRFNPSAASVRRKRSQPGGCNSMRSLNGFLFAVLPGVLLVSCTARSTNPFGSSLPPITAQSQMRPAGPSTVDWPTFGFNRQRWSYNGSESTLSTSTVKKLMLKWSVSLGTGVSNTQPILAANVTLPNKSKTQVIFAGNEDGQFTAIDALAGKVLWSKHLGKTSSSCFGGASNGITSAPVIDHSRNRVYVIDGRGKLWAFKIATGMQDPGFGPIQVFTHPLDNHTWSGLLLDPNNAMLYYPVASHCDNTLYYGTINAVEVSTKKISTFQLVTDKKKYYGNGVWSWGGESLDPDTTDLYAGIGNSLGKEGEHGQYSDSIIELTPQLGFIADEQPESDLKNDWDIGTTPVPYDIGSSRCAAFERKDGNFFTIDRAHLQNGSYGSKLALGGALATAAYWPVGKALFVNVPAGLTRLDALAGCKATKKWQTSIGASGNSVPSVANGVVYASGSNTLYALDASSGSILWNSGSSVGNEIVAEPTVVNGRVYVTAWDGKMYAFGL
jgi:outer membrane protein assembly factor BamB